MRVQVQFRSFSEKAFTLVEVVISSLIGAVVMAGIIYGYVMSAERTEWSSYYQAAQSIAMQRMEQTRAAKWEVQTTPQTDELQSTNFPVVVKVLDIPERKKWWLGPILFMMVLLSILIVVTEKSVIAPFIYALF